MSVTLSHVPPDRLTEADLKLLDIFARKWCNGTTVKDLMREIVERRLVIFRVTGDAKGLLGMEKVRDEIWLNVLIGRGFVESIRDIWAEILAVAAKHGGRRVSVWVQRPGIGRVLKSIGLQQQAVLFGQEITDGAQ